MQTSLPTRTRTEALTKHGRPGVGAEEVLDDARAERLAKVRYARLEARAAEDAPLVLLLQVGNGRTSSDRALAEGYALGDVKLARARLKRHIEAVVREIPSRAEEKEWEDES